MERQRWVDRKSFCREVTVMTETNSLGDGQSRTSTPGAAHNVVPAGDRPSRPMPPSAHVPRATQKAPDPYGDMPLRPERRPKPKNT
ncbi:hypothetical protein KBB85_00960 [Patescibacteria group bacterium]|nr:hypothetical protein [Patescibacteria group bacterium]